MPAPYKEAHIALPAKLYTLIAKDIIADHDILLPNRTALEKECARIIAAPLTLNALPEAYRDIGTQPEIQSMLKETIIGYARLNYVRDQLAQRGNDIDPREDAPPGFANLHKSQASPTYYQSMKAQLAGNFFAALNEAGVEKECWYGLALLLLRGGTACGVLKNGIGVSLATDASLYTLAHQESLSLPAAEIDPVRKTTYIDRIDKVMADISDVAGRNPGLPTAPS